MKKTVCFGIVLLLILSQTAFAGEGPSAEARETLSATSTKGKFYEGIGLGPEKLWRVTPGLKHSTVYDSNVNREPGHAADHDIIMNFTPSVALSRIGSYFGILSDYEMDYQLYLRDTSQSSFNHRFNNKFWYKSDKLTTRMNHAFGYVKTYATSEQSERRTVLYNEVNPEVIYRVASKTSVSALYRNYIFSYRDAALKDSSYVKNDFGGRVYYHMTPKLDVYLQGSALLTNYYRNDALDSDGFGVYAGAIGALSPKTTITAQTGFEGREYDNGAINSFYNWVGELAVIHRLTAKTDMIVNAKRGIEESVYQNTGWYDFNRFGLDFHYHIRPKVTAEFGGSYQHNNYPSETTEYGSEIRKRDDNLLIAKSKLKWEVRENLVTALGYIFSTRISNLDLYDYNDHMVEASISYKI